jgi:hypothetical protein
LVGSQVTEQTVGPHWVWMRAVTSLLCCPPVLTRNAPTASLPVPAAM